MNCTHYTIPSKITVFTDAKLIYEDKSKQLIQVQVKFTHVKEDLFRISTNDSTCLVIEHSEDTNEHRD